MTRVEADLAVLKENSLEEKLHRRIRPLLSRRLGLRRTQVLQSPVQDTHPELLEPVEKAFDAGDIDDEQETRINATDFIVRAQRKADRAPVWVAVEASNAISRRDLDRARRTADALTARGKIPAAFDGRCIPAELRCSSVEYGQYAPSSRLVSRAPRPSRCDAGFHHGLLSAVFSQDTLAVVAGYRIQPQDRRRGDEAGVHALLVDDEK